MGVKILTSIRFILCMTVLPGMCVCMHLHVFAVLMVVRGGEWVHDGCKPPCMFWEQQPSPRQEEQLLLITKPSLHTQDKYLERTLILCSFSKTIVLSSPLEFRTSPASYFNCIMRWYLIVSSSFSQICDLPISTSQEQRFRGKYHHHVGCHLLFVGLFSFTSNWVQST